jgi:light-regulated signal transduction histidine kinase (bacteriophytochrome)
MSISLLREGRLWGLISCHHGTPRQLGFRVRAACDLIGQVLSLQLATNERAPNAAYRIELQTRQRSLLAAMAEHENYIEGLLKRPDDLLACCSAESAAIVRDGKCVRVGPAPAEADLRRIAD